MFLKSSTSSAEVITIVKTEVTLYQRGVSFPFYYCGPERPGFAWICKYVLPLFIVNNNSKALFEVIRSRLCQHTTDMHMKPSHKRSLWRRIDAGMIYTAGSDIRLKFSSWSVRELYMVTVSGSNAVILHKEMSALHVFVVKRRGARSPNSGVSVVTAILQLLLTSRSSTKQPLGVCVKGVCGTLPN